MRSLKEILKYKKINFEKLLQYGFQQQGKIYEYKQPFKNGAFYLLLRYDGTDITSQVIDMSSEEEYILVDIKDTVGAFVGSIQEEYEQQLNLFLDTCTEQDNFHSNQAHQIINYIEKKYHEKLEYLWPESSKNAVFRHQEDKRWYAVLFLVKGTKLGLLEEREIEALNVKALPEKVEQLVDGKRYLKAYHMNKKHWFTIKLDGSIPLETIYDYLDKSYEITKDKKTKKR